VSDSDITIGDYYQERRRLQTQLDAARERIAQLEAALRKYVEWCDAEEQSVPYDSDAGRAHWNRKQRLCRESEDMARAAISSAAQPGEGDKT